jgi:glucose/arabinose dehydrogenase
MINRSIFFLFMLIGLSGCYRMLSSEGGGQGDIRTDSRPVNAKDIELPPGYTAEAVATGLTFPTDLTFDDQGLAYVIEAGYSYGEVFLEPKLLRLEQGGGQTQIATGQKNGPWTGLTFHNGNFYVSEGGQMEGGKILRITRDGSLTILAEGLPSLGDHHTDVLVIGSDGYIYFGQGTATNSGIVGTDNADFGWLKRFPDYHDVPCADVTLTGQNFTTESPLPDRPGQQTTGAYSPYGTPTTDGQVIKGSVPCSGAVMRVPLEGGAPELVAWGFRNPFGIAFAPDGKLYVTDNSYDERGSRPVWGTGDYLWQVQPGTWYGWPDYSGGLAFDGKKFAKPGGEAPKPLLAKHPNKPPRPSATLGVHSSSNGMDFSRSDGFGYQGQAFIAQFGDMAPNAGKVLDPVGFKVVRVDVSNGNITDFATNKGKDNGPASKLKHGGLERPVAVKFSPDGQSLYIVDFGVMQMTDQGPAPQQKTGVVWKVSKNNK